MVNIVWHILRLGNWKVTITALPDSAAACRDNPIKTRPNWLPDYLTYYRLIDHQEGD